MDPKNQLKRYLYLGTTNLFYNKKGDSLNIETIDKYLACIKVLAEGDDPLVPLNIIKKAITENSLHSNKQAIIALVYCVRNTDNNILRTNVYKLLPELLPSANDLFLFIKYNVDMKKTKGFGHGLKNAMSIWYNKFEPKDMANMLMKNKKIHGFYHYQIIKLCHIKFINAENNLIIKTLFKKNKTDIIKEHDTEKLKENIGLSLLINNYKLNQYNCNEEITKEKKDLSYQIIRENKYDIDQIPTNLLHYPRTWKLYINKKHKFTYQELLRFLPILNDFHLLCKENIKRNFLIALGNKKTVKTSKIHPIDIFIALRLYQNNMRYLKVVKENYHLNKLNKLNKVINEEIIEKLKNALNISMTSYFEQKSGVNYFITIDLKKKFLRKGVCGMDLIKCSELAILLALSILKREDNVTIARYTTTLELKEVALTKNMTFDEAFEFCHKLHETPLKHNLQLPIDYALKEMKKVDIFLTITDSISQLCHKRIPPIANLRTYKEKMENNFTKYIILNLSRTKQDLTLLETNEDFLEIAGFSTEVPKIIDAFAKRLFV